jgi:hypothetical protein
LLPRYPTAGGLTTKQSKKNQFILNIKTFSDMLRMQDFALNICIWGHVQITLQINLAGIVGLNGKIEIWMGKFFISLSLG